LFSKFLY